MSGYTVIGGVTRTLGEFLRTETGVNVEYDRSPAEVIPDTGPLIHVYLYRVEPNPFFVNGDWIRASDTVLQQPPIGLNLHYLITPHGTGQLQIQVTLGEIIRVFHDHAIIPPAAYDAALAGSTEELRVVPRPRSLEEMTELWRAFEGRSYRLAATYEASVVLIDSGVTRTVTRVVERHVQVGQRR
ncbi:MAG: DUF4255 domain-containing protein [Candidatus Rokuibacteriota bacterium]